MQLPFEIYPETMDCYPSQYMINLRHLQSGQEAGVPWTGYYAMLKEAKLAVSNMFRAWFKIEQWGDKWAAIRLAHIKLNLQGHTLSGLNTIALIKLGKPTNAKLVENAWSESRASQQSQHDPPPH